MSSAARSGSHPGTASSQRRIQRACSAGATLADAFHERGKVEQRMSHSDVAPIEDHRGALRPPHVARMEVAVDERVGHAARVEVVEDRRQPRDERVEDASRVGGAPRATTSAARSRYVARRQSGAPSASSSSSRPTHSICKEMSVSSIASSWSLLGFVAVVAGDVGEQHPSRLAGDESRHACVVAERAQHRGLVREERWHVLEPHEPVVSGDLPDRRQVPRPDLHGRAGDRHVARCPREIRVGAAGTRVGQPQGIVGERLLPWREQRRPRRRA